MKRILLVILIALAITAGLMAGLAGARDVWADLLPVLFEGEFTGGWYNTGHNVADGPYTSTAGNEASVWGTFDSGSGKIKNPEFAWTMTTPSEEIYSVTVCASRWGTPWDGEPADQGTNWEPGSFACTTDGAAFELDGMNCQSYECDSYVTFDDIRHSGELHCDGDPSQECGWDVKVLNSDCVPVTDVSLDPDPAGIVDFDADYSVITITPGSIHFDLDYLPLDATGPVTEFVEAQGGDEYFVPGSPEGYWVAGWDNTGTYTLTYAAANCDGTGDLGDTSVPCYDGHQWEQSTVHVITQCFPLENIWLNGESSGHEFQAEVGEIWQGTITYSPDHATRDSIEYPGEFDRSIWATGEPYSIATQSNLNFVRYDELNFSFKPELTGTLLITYSLANCSESTGWTSSLGSPALTATLQITDTVPITYLIPITQPVAPTMDCTYCLRPSEVCTEDTSICILTSWIDWQVCLQRCWFDFGLDWSIYIFQLFQWWTVELVNFQYAWLRYFWMSAMYQYEEIYNKWSAIQTLVSAYYHNYATFIQSLAGWINISSVNIISSFDEIAAFLAGKIAQMAPLLSAWSTELSDWIGAVRDALEDWTGDTFDKLGRFLKNFVLFLRIIYLFIRMATASGLEKLRIAWKIMKLSAQLMSTRLLGPFRSVIKSIRQMAELAGELGSGAKAAINSDTKANLFSFGTNFSEYNAAHQLDGMQMQTAEAEGGLSYTLEGLEFFEDLAGSSPLNFASYISIGILALRLSMWTLAKARDLMEDLRHF